VKRTAQAVFFTMMLFCCVSATQVSAQTRGKSHEECLMLVPGDWRPNFGEQWHQHESVYWGCRLGIPPQAVSTWQDPFGMIQDVRLASINNQQFAYVEHMEGSAHCYSFAAFRRIDERWERVWDQGSPDYCMLSCLLIKMTVVGSTLVLRVPQSNNPQCKNIRFREEYRWDGKSFERVSPPITAAPEQANATPDRPTKPGKPAPTQSPVAQTTLKQKWVAASTTALSITGDVTLTPHKIVMSHKEFPLTPAREIDKQRLYDVGQILDYGQAPPSARLYKTRISGRSHLVNGNTICGPNEDARWVLVVESNDNLSLAFFSGESEPNLDYHVVRVSYYLCGTYSYIPPGK
jgi:hypothetical protein